MADTNFYRAFEDRYRGSRELIKSRLAVYLPFILPLKQFYGDCPAVDLGCGRGEWLEILHESGFDPQGVDLDDGMLEECRKIGLQVHTHDAIDFLQGLPEASQIVVSGFHLAEHLPFELLQALIQESLRVLKPGGLLILETPNPENITVGTEKFYLDPTHYRPIPSQFLSFMAEYVGFERINVLRLQEPSGLANEGSLILLSVLNGVSPDYAVVAQKAGAAEIITATTAAFETDYGLSLERLANNYDLQIKTSIHQTDAKLQHTDSIARQADAKAEQAEVQSRHAESIAQQANDALSAVRDSTSWRLTAPLRVFGNIAKTLKSKSKEKIKLVLAHTRLYIIRRPRLMRVSLCVLAFVPSLKVRLIQATPAPQAPSAPTPTIMAPIAAESDNMTLRARRIYNELKAKIEKSDKETT